LDELERQEPSPEISDEGVDTDAQNEQGKGTNAQVDEPVDKDAQIMGRLPRTRPQRRTARRSPNAQEAAAQPKRNQGARRQRSSAAAGTRARASSASRSTSNRAGRRRPGESASAAAARKRAPSAPRLALDAAVGAAKVPFKLTGAVTREARRLIGRGLRLR
jgi:hypothetical protein